MKNKSLYKIARCGIFAAIICVCSFIAIPIGVIPVTASLMCIMLSGIVLTPLEAFAATVVYVIMGALGLPVFSGGSGGIGVLLGPTGGYIWSYPFCALLVSFISHIKVKNKILSFAVPFFGSITGTLPCYTLGTVQYMLVCNASFYTALVACVIPFVIVDVLKAATATVIGVPLRKRLGRF